MITRPHKPGQTMADYLAIGVSPALVMTLVGSLVLLLLEASYSGPWLGSVRWTLCWFAFAIVLVSRIAIERTRLIALGYGLMLAGATSLFLVSHFGFVLPVWLLLGLIWWSSDKITWDCTLIDDDVDSSGAGLLQSGPVGKLANPHPGLVKAVGAPKFAEPVTSALVKPAKRSNHPKPVPKRQQLHAPGLWVLYFSLAAIPLFGFGEILLPASEPAARRLGFYLVVVYLASATGLLLLSSFLGLRRYLRQRWVPMPSAIAFSWVKTGLFFIAGLLLAATLLPRPITPYSLDRLVSTQDSVERGRTKEPPPEKNDVSKEMEGKQPGQPPQ